MDSYTTQNKENVHLEKDQRLIIFLLTSSKVSYIGTKNVNGTILFKFSPKEAAKDEINIFYSGKCLVEAGKLLDASVRFKNELFRAKYNY
ncbi:hypothetical protein A2892_04255 [Candidatus Woesebacteria bacterium RIFCSPLOWO2_01_FULL_39_10b]|uniref:DUF5659 domain-containing protein n=1 Tax=Candidatus Woesebacteria bacterium RIFCSPLOWO2_01_FULL_39_10b TaxID=1802517 RepID=A0A1F8B889_9BACT|nr:MAG: hypothetical protein A2892_04255 [Candidatus Woesebacteria bacterium RIFCSPLOWO2_01_FULL_39_10b]